MAEEKQNAIPAPQELLLRDDKGRWPPGISGNITGGKQRTGWQPIGKRYMVLGEKYTSEEIVNLAADPERCRIMLSYWDCVCIVQMARAIERNMTITDSGSDQMNKERNSMLDRIEGTPVQTIINTTADPIAPEEMAAVSPEEAASAMDKLNSL